MKFLLAVLSPPLLTLSNPQNATITFFPYPITAMDISISTISSSTTIYDVWCHNYRGCRGGNMIHMVYTPLTRGFAGVATISMSENWDTTTMLYSGQNTFTCEDYGPGSASCTATAWGFSKTDGKELESTTFDIHSVFIVETYTASATTVTETDREAVLASTPSSDRLITSFVTRPTSTSGVDEFIDLNQVNIALEL
jgi:hypothetical protein